MGTFLLREYTLTRNQSGVLLDFKDQLEPLIAVLVWGFSPPYRKAGGGGRRSEVSLWCFETEFLSVTSLAVLEPGWP